MEITVITHGPERTQALAAALGRLLVPGDVLVLVGPLGAGKTVFVKGLAQGLAADPAVPVTSPSFTILHEYPGPLPLYHFDFYRLGCEAELEGLGYEEFFDGPGVCAVEWADKFPRVMSQALMEIHLAPAGESVREITFLLPAAGERGRELAQALAAFRADKK
jgi:tRNA threonylcarbamoyladenosine biosynthesis protein TsaE